ncbi:hypothetical protein GCM10017687_01860 [Streptomyces echinatus]
MIEHTISCTRVAEVLQLPAHRVRRRVRAVQPGALDWRLVGATGAAVPIIGTEPPRVSGRAFPIPGVPVLSPSSADLDSAQPAPLARAVTGSAPRVRPAARVASRARSS